MYVRFALLLFLPALLSAEAWKAGVAQVKITPRQPVWMAGYGSRDHPSEGVAQDLWAKALALEDPAGRRLVIVTTDLIGLTRPIAASIAVRVHRKHRLSRERLVLTSSHTHAGPTLGNSLRIMYDLTPEQAGAVRGHTRFLEERIVEVIGRALADLADAELSYHRGRAGFAMNRRERTEQGIKLGVNPKGPVDHDVPALKVLSAQGKLRAALFSYACHNTTLTGRMYKFHGDYAGVAQEVFEKEHPGATALFMIGCGADANPEPRGTIEHAERHGRELSAAVAEAIAAPGRKVAGTLRSEFIRFPVPLAPPPSREEFRARLNGENRFLRRHAAYFLAMPEIPAEYEYSLQAVKLGEAVTLIAMAGEVVVGYGLELKKEFGEERTWPVAYANDVFGYVPTRKILEEGGYEAERSQIYYGWPGPWAAPIERIILDKARELVSGL